MKPAAPILVLAIVTLTFIGCGSRAEPPLDGSSAAEVGVAADLATIADSSADAGVDGVGPAPDDDMADAVALEAFARKYGDVGAFMGTVLVSRRGRVLLDKPFGFANAEWEVPHTTGSKFRLGSISKMFTAVAVLLLAEEGRLQVEDLLSRHLPDLPPAWAPITLHQLLAHTSGIPDVVNTPDYPVLRTQPSTVEQRYQWLRDKPLEFPPGQQFKYSNSGYIILALVIERVTAKKFDDVLQERVWGPLGLADTGADTTRALIKRRADGYVPLEEPAPPPAGPSRLPFRNCDYIDMTYPIGGGSLYSTTGDLLKWIKGLFGGGLLSPASLARMTSLQAGNYGYGIFVAQQGGRRRLGHSGYIHGFMTAVTYFPETDVVVVVLSNLTASRWVNELAEGLVNLANGFTPDTRPGAGGSPDPEQTPVTARTEPR